MRVVPTVLVVCLSALVVPQGKPTSPGAGSPERTRILNALRTPVEKELKTKVKFKVDHLKVQNGWAFMTGKPLQSNGKPVDYRKTRYRQALEDGVFDDWVCALFRHKKGKWTLVTYSIGATDVVWDGWDKQYKAPRAIFPYGG